MKNLEWNVFIGAIVDNSLESLRTEKKKVERSTLENKISSLIDFGFSQIKMKQINGRGLELYSK